MPGVLLMRLLEGTLCTKPLYVFCSTFKGESNHSVRNPFNPSNTDRLGIILGDVGVTMPPDFQPILSQMSSYPLMSPLKSTFDFVKVNNMNVRNMAVKKA